tara:strand:- start:2713 stop:3447 length:735 start_codon:yes stop_codon:yes gene_type:complete
MAEIKTTYCLIFIMFCCFTVCHSAEDRSFKFKIAGCNLSSQLSDQQQDTSIFIAYEFLERQISLRLLEAGIKPANESGLKFVQFNGANLIIRGVQGPVQFKASIDTRFYQYTDQKEDNVIHLDFILTTGREKRDFFDGFLDLITLPAGLIFEAVLNVVFAATHIKADMSDYLEVDVKGSGGTGSFFKRIGAAFVNLFLPGEHQIKVERAGHIEFRLNKAKELLSKVRNLEIGYEDQGMLVNFYD